MICEPCRGQQHAGCPGKGHCDCQHRTKKKAPEPAEQQQR